MFTSLRKDMSPLVVVLYVILIQSVLGTFFPAVSNPPPIPAQAVRTLENSPQGFYIQENLAQDFSTQQGLFPPEEKVEDQRWYIQENQSYEIDQDKRSTETPANYYPNGEPAIGPVATPIPDTYISRPSSISQLNPNDPGNPRIWIMARGSENPYSPDRWIQVQIPANRLIEVVNQEPPYTTDAVKSVEATNPPGVPVKKELTANSLANIIQQIWIRPPHKVSSLVNGNPMEIIEGIPSVKQIVDIPTANDKKIVQQVFKDSPTAPFSPPVIVPSPILSKKLFTAPPDPPPPYKGFDTTSKTSASVSINDIPDSQVPVTGNGLDSQLRHAWVPTSLRTGKFLSFPVPRNVNSGKSVVNGNFPQDSTPVAVSDTWVLRQKGSFPNFEQQKSVPPFTEIQNGKVIFQSSPVTELGELSNPAVSAQFDSPENPSVIGKSVGQNAPVDIWSSQKGATNSKVLGTFPRDSLPALIPSPPKSDGIIITETLTGEKSVANSKFSVSPLIPQPGVKVSGGKPCPIPKPQPQNYLFPPRNSALIAVPRVIDTQRRPLASIIRINRYPSNSYYVLHNQIRPNYLSHPSAALLQQSKTQIIRLVRTNRNPLQFRNKEPVAPLQSKQIYVPTQSAYFSYPMPAEHVNFPFSIKQSITPVTSPNSPRILYSSQQAIPYTYPWDRYSNYNSVSGKGVYNPQFGPLKANLPVANSDASAEISSESSPSEPEQDQKQIPKKADITQNEDSDSSDEKKKQFSSEETKKRKETTAEETKPKEENVKASESRISQIPVNTAGIVNTNFALSEVRNAETDEARAVLRESSHLNLISNQETTSYDKIGLE